MGNIDAVTYENQATNFQTNLFQTLHIMGFVKHLLGYLRNSSRDSELARIVCHGIGMMSRYEPAADEIMQENPIKYIMGELFKRLRYLHMVV